MCGIIARIGLNSNPIKSLKALKELEYRGYDSYGILINNYFDNDTLLVKDIGEIKENEIEFLSNKKSNIELGHTRWATHGCVSNSNAHPHVDDMGRYFVVMNGIIENFEEIKKELTIGFTLQNDTKLIPYFYDFYHDDNLTDYDNLIQSTKKVLKRLKGDFSFVIKYKNYILTYKNSNPIIIGKNKDEIFICSDNMILNNNCEMTTLLDDYEISICKLEGNNLHLEFRDKEFNQIEKRWNKCSPNKIAIIKDTQYFMEKEILEQISLRNILTDYNIENIKELSNKLKNTKNIFLIGAGTSYHAAYYLHYKLLENNVHSNLIIASELDHYINIIKDSTVICFSQSGETADIISPLKKIDNSNEIFSIVNTKYSTLDRMSKKSIYLNCGKEIGVASTKAFTAQMFISQLISNYIKSNSIIEIDDYEKQFSKVLSENNKILDKIVSDFCSSKAFFFLGKKHNYPLAIEGALKLKEISYKFCEGFAGGELKHGTLSLIEDKIPVIVIGDNDNIISNAIEVKTRGGHIIGINDNEDDVYDYFIKIPKSYKELFSVIIMQVIAFKMSNILGLNPDKPRNLAKSVTVK